MVGIQSLKITTKLIIPSSGTDQKCTCGSTERAKIEGKHFKMDEKKCERETQRHKKLDYIVSQEATISNAIERAACTFNLFIYWLNDTLRYLVRNEQ